MLENLNLSSSIIEYPTINNIYYIINEVSQYCNPKMFDKDEDSLVLDDYYGRVFTKYVYDNICPYGITTKMPYYDCMGQNNYDIIGHFRVPYRKIPIFHVKSNIQAKEIIDSVSAYYKYDQILFRGQERTYFLDAKRTDEEKLKLFGELTPREPSFLSSHIRKASNENFLRCLWNWQGRVLLNDIGVDLHKTLPQEDLNKFYESKDAIEGTELLSYFSLGMAQHYGLPSVGLDLTDNYEVALCFATTHYDKDSANNLKVSMISDFDESMIYIFRCSKSNVFDYKYTKPDFFPNSRPDFQHAWFCHAGWGYAKNQMALDLVCCIKVTSDMAKDINQEVIKSIFPSEEDDIILKHFLKMKNKEYFAQEVKDVLSSIYKVVF